MSSVEPFLSDFRAEERPLLVMDMAEHNPRAWSDSSSLLDRWRRWKADAYWRLLPRHKGHVVRDMGTGLMMEFTDARHCVRAAFALNQLADSLNAQAEESRQLHLRAAAHLARYSRGHREPVDQDMQWVSELSAWAAPGELVITAELRDRLANGVDADLEDMGPQVGPFAQSAHLFRAHPRHNESAGHSTATHADPCPALAIMPFKASAPQAAHTMIGELIADGVIARLSHSIGLLVISRQSTSALRDNHGLGEIQRHLGASFVMSGSFSIRNDQLLVTAELVEICSHKQLWTGQLKRPLGDLFSAESELLYELARTVARVLKNTRAGQALTRPLPSLDSSFLMLAGISMGHSHTGEAFERGREALIELIARHPRFALPRAWLGMWHALNVIMGRSTRMGHDTQLAHEQAMRALDVEPNNPMALAVEGYIQCQLLSDPQQANRYLMSAIEANPSEPMAWLFKSLHSSMWGSGAWSATEAGFARALSPLDPLQYLFDLLTANAMLADHRPELALAYGRKSLRAHKHHVPTLRLLLTAQAELGRIDEGKKTLAELLARAPNLTVSSYLAMGSAESTGRQRMANAMRLLGLPES